VEAYGPEQAQIAKRRTACRIHLKALLRKLNAQSRTQAALWGTSERI